MMKKDKVFNLVYSNKTKINFNSRNLIIGKWLFTDFLKNKRKNVEFYENNWMNKKKQLEDFQKVKKIYLEVLKTLAINLNYYHSKKFELRQWEIIIFFSYITISQLFMIDGILLKELKKNISSNLLKLPRTTYQIFCAKSQLTFLT